MRDRQLHSALHAFAEEAAWALAAETEEGAEIPFDLVEERGARGPSLYCYRADTAGFISDRAAMLARLENRPAAARALAGASGLDAYLRSRGHTRVPDEPRARAEAALDAFVERLFEDMSEFVLGEERFERASDELDRHLTGGALGVEVIVPLLGLTIGSDEVALGGGLSLVRPGALDRVPEQAAWDGADPTVLALLRGDDETVAAHAPARVRRLVTALRLYDEACVAMGPAAWVRTAGGPWLVAPTGAGSLPYGTVVLGTDQEDELRAFCNLVWRRMPRGGELAWALARFEMGSERPPHHRLTDHLLALRALLGGGDDDLLADRVAALCAEPAGRAEVADRIDVAIEVERSLIGGHGRVAQEAEAVAAGVAEHLRAILRDVLCGHLDANLRRLADELRAELVGAETATQPA